ncbi:MAG: hypothetical protein ACK55P_15610, partial [Planctomyces sp.]
LQFRTSFLDFGSTPAGETRTPDGEWPQAKFRRADIASIHASVPDDSPGRSAPAIRKPLSKIDLRILLRRFSGP